MENKNENVSKSYLNETILRYPFNGRSKYLIDKFYIIGYDSKALYKNLIEDYNFIDDNNNMNKSNSSLNISLDEILAKTESKKIPKTFKIEDPPTILNEITSDYKKQVPDKDLIKDMIFPNKLDFYSIEENTKAKSFHSEGNITRIKNSLYSKITSDFIGNNSINTIFECIYVDDYNSSYNNKYIKPYNVIFSYNPQTENDSKKSIYGFAHIFYRKYYKSRNLGEKKYSFFVPNVFCIISEFPFYNSFYLLCNQIKHLYNEKKIEIPLEILIYNLINFTLSPLNNDIFLYIEPIKFPTNKIEIEEFKEVKNKIIDLDNIKEVYETEISDINKKGNISEIDIIEEIDEEKGEDNKNKNKNKKKVSFSNSNNDIINSKNIFNSKIKSASDSDNKNYNTLENYISNDNNIYDDIYENVDEQNSDNEKNVNIDILPKGTDKSMRKSLSQSKPQKKIKALKSGGKTEIKFRTKLKNKIQSIHTVHENKNRRLTSSIINTTKSGDVKNRLNSSFSISSKSYKFYENIKFCLLPGYPLIQYNLVKVLLNVMSPMDVIIIFFHTFLEIDVVFFSKDIEYLSLTIDAYLNLNFPLNDEKYYFYNACVSYDNYINNNSTFVGSTFTTILGVNSPYVSEYKNTAMAKSKKHLCVDLDNGNLHFMKDNNDSLFKSQNIDIFDYIKKVIKNKDDKDEKDSILCREIKIINEKLYDYKNKLNNKNNFEFYNHVSKSKLIDYNEENTSYENIKKINTDIQEAFYRLTNNLSLYFYENLSLKDDINKEKKQQSKNNKLSITNSIRKSLRKSYDNETMSIIFKRDDSEYTKEELAFLDELTDTMKFESFVYGFIQSYNPIDLYKIPLTFTEEFLSILTRKNTNLKNINFNFLSLIDNLYQRNVKKNLYVDLNPFLCDYYKKYKYYFDREILDEYNKNINLNINNSVVGINFKSDNGKKVVDSFKYKSYELDHNILLKYKTFINNLDSEEYHHMYYMASTLEKNDIKNILLTDIENEIENYSIEIGLLTKNDICCSNIILLFVISLKEIINKIDCTGFLLSLSQNFIIFRKYFTMIINILYQLLKESLNTDNFYLAKKYYSCYYPLMDALKSLELVPNECLMNIIKKLNLIKTSVLFDKAFNDKNKNEENIINIGSGLNFNSKSIHISHNFDKNKFYTIKEVLEMVNSSKEDLKLNYSKENKNNYVEPRIVYDDGTFKYKCKFKSQAKILSILNQQYKTFYSNQFDKNKLNIKDIFDACLNIDVYIRNSDDFKNEQFVIDQLQNIFNLYLKSINEKK